ncbi:leguminosin proline-rich group669 secreted peptide [Trifolium medium]|uniref:Leguminosin proline-rich group669 secreted peptide n=1 Tax=Trifolium medium TaxID=97028 RepID=A0A392MX19_9FABA|nr:leguminosin proline-rich group669 secreted peptide [Trifolium medium]
MSFLSLLVLFLAVISLTNIAGNPKQQIHAQPNGLINNQPSIIEPHTSGPNNHRPPLPVRPPIRPPPIRPPPVPIPPPSPITPPKATTTTSRSLR